MNIQIKVMPGGVLLTFGDTPDNLSTSALGSTGEKQKGSPKLTAEQVAEIRASSESQSALADKYGVSQTQISRIKRREHWKTKPGERI